MPRWSCKYAISTHHQLAQTPPPLVRLWAEARRQVEPEKNPKGTTSRLKSAYQADLLSFEQHLRKDAPPRPVPIRNLKKQMLAAAAGPSSPAGGASAEVSDHKDWPCITPCVTLTAGAHVLDRTDLVQRCASQETGTPPVANAAGVKRRAIAAAGQSGPPAKGGKRGKVRPKNFSWQAIFTTSRSFTAHPKSKHKCLISLAPTQVNLQ